MPCQTILVVEDDMEIRNALVQTLELEGYSVRSAQDGKEGLAMLGAIEGPCLILLDLMMPVMNGLEFLQARKENSAIATIPVVVVSAFSEKAKLAREESQGFIKKPINIDQLLSFVKRFCG